MTGQHFKSTYESDIGLEDFTMSKALAEQVDKTAYEGIHL